jgi:hypothetical protein
MLAFVVVIVHDDRSDNDIESQRQPHYNSENEDDGMQTALFWHILSFISNTFLVVVYVLLAWENKDDDDWVLATLVVFLARCLFVCLCAGNAERCCFDRITSTTTCHLPILLGTLLIPMSQYVFYDCTGITSHSMALSSCVPQICGNKTQWSFFLVAKARKWMGWFWQVEKMIGLLTCSYNSFW